MNLRLRDLTPGNAAREKAAVVRVLSNRSVRSRELCSGPYTVSSAKTVTTAALTSLCVWQKMETFWKSSYRDGREYDIRDQTVPNDEEQTHSAQGGKLQYQAGMVCQNVGVHVSAFFV